MTWLKVCPVVMCLLDVCFLTPAAYFWNYFPPHLFCVHMVINDNWLLFSCRLFKSVTTLWGPRFVDSGFSESPWTVQCCHRVYSALFLGWQHKVLKRVYSLKKQIAVMLSISSWQVKYWEKMVANHLCDTGIVSRICKSENKQLNYNVGKRSHQRGWYMGGK